VTVSAGSLANENGGVIESRPITKSEFAKFCQTSCNQEEQNTRLSTMDASRPIASGQTSATQRKLCSVRKFGGVDSRKSRNRTPPLARPNSRELAGPGRSTSGTGPDRLAQLQAQPFNVTSRARRRSQGAAATPEACGYSNDHEYLHASGSDCFARGEQQSRSIGFAGAGGLALMAPHGPSRICKPLFRKEILVGAVGSNPCPKLGRAVTQLSVFQWLRCLDWQDSPDSASPLAGICVSISLA
jgi:hypothetical protein